MISDQLAVYITVRRLPNKGENAKSRNVETEREKAKAKEGLAELNDHAIESAIVSTARTTHRASWVSDRGSESV